MYSDILQFFASPAERSRYEPIRRSIEALLNGRIGNVAYKTTFGMPDFMDSISSNYRERLRNEVLNQIRMNEPRIKNVECDGETQLLSLSSTRYELMVTLMTEEQIGIRVETSGSVLFHVKF